VPEPVDGVGVRVVRLGCVKMGDGVGVLKSAVAVGCPGTRVGVIVFVGMIVFVGVTVFVGAGVGVTSTEMGTTPLESSR